MSAYVEVNTQMKDRDCLIETLKSIFPQAEIEIHDTPQALYGYRGDIRETTANVIVRRKYIGSASNDLGFSYKDGAYAINVSEYDQRYLVGHLKIQGKFAEHVQQQYAKNMALKTANRLRMQVQNQEVGKNGEIRIRLTRWA